MNNKKLSEFIKEIEAIHNIDYIAIFQNNKIIFEFNEFDEFKKSNIINSDTIVTKWHLINNIKGVKSLIIFSDLEV